MELYSYLGKSAETGSRQRELGPVRAVRQQQATIGDVGWIHGPAEDGAYP
jgi:hypothetical protein